MTRQDTLMLTSTLVALGALSTAGVTIWLFLTSPMAVASLVTAQPDGSVMRMLASLLFDLLVRISHYL
jgi:hypothetical protein